MSCLVDLLLLLSTWSDWVLLDELPSSGNFSFFGVAFFLKTFLHPSAQWKLRPSFLLIFSFYLIFLLFTVVWWRFKVFPISVSWFLSLIGSKLSLLTQVFILNTPDIPQHITFPSLSITRALNSLDWLKVNDLGPYVFSQVVNKLLAKVVSNCLS